MRRESLKAGVPRGVRVLTAGAPPAAATIQRVEEELGWTVTQLYGLTETSPLMTFCEELPEHASSMPEGQARQKARQGVEQITGGEVRVVDGDGVEVPRRRPDPGRDRRPRQRRDARLLQRPGGHRAR